MVWYNKWSKGSSNGWGKSWGSGWGKKRPWSRGGKSGKPLPKDTTIDKTKRYQGTVESYRKWSGFGWVNLNEKGVVPDDKVFLYWKSIKTDDRFPTLNKDMTVEFGLHPYKSKKSPDSTFVRAKAVTLPGTKSINIQDEQDKDKKTFIGGQLTRYTGSLKFFKKSYGFGYIIMDDGFSLSEPVPKEIRVEAAEFNSGTKEPLNIKKDTGLKVEFGIWKTKKGAYKAYNMTLPKSTPITQELLEGRQTTGSKTYAGTVSKNMWKQGYGFIDVDLTAMLPPNVTAKMLEMNEAAKSKGKDVPDSKSLYFRASDVRDMQWLKKDQKVEFQIYTDAKGVGAMDIH